MRRQARNLTLLVVLLAVLAVSYFGLRWYNGRQQDKESESEGEVLVDIARDDILRFSYVFEGETYVFEKVEGRWVSASDMSLELKQSRLDTMAGKLTRIVAQSTIHDVTDMSQYGLETPANVLHWETAQGSYTYHVGDYNSIGSVYYICESDSDTVYVVATALGTGFDYSLEELIEQEEMDLATE